MKKSIHSKIACHQTKSYVRQQLSIHRKIFPSAHLVQIWAFKGEGEYLGIISRAEGSFPDKNTIIIGSWGMKFFTACECLWQWECRTIGLRPDDASAMLKVPCTPDSPLVNPVMTNALESVINGWRGAQHPTDPPAIPTPSSIIVVFAQTWPRKSKFIEFFFRRDCIRCRLVV